MKIVVYKEDTWSRETFKQGLISFVDDKLRYSDDYENGKIESIGSQVDNIIEFLSKLTEILCEKGVLKTADLRNVCGIKVDPNIGKQLINIEDA